MGMNSQDFDKMMSGQHMKAAIEGDFQIRPFAEMLKDKRQSDDPERLNKDREALESKSQEVPDHINNEVQAYIKTCRGKKMSERRIRRAVMRKFNISVI